MITAPPLYLPGDKVYYTGDKFKERLNGKPGWIHAPVIGSLVSFIVEFPDTRNPKDQNDTDDYIMSTKVLSRWRPEQDKKIEKDKKHEGPEVQPRRRKRDPEEEQS